MTQTILSVAYPLTEVGPDAVGGSEQILTLLDRTITKAGHRSLVIAAEGSKVHGTLIPAPRNKGILDNAVRDWGRRVHRQLIKETLAKYQVDLVHMHSLDFHCYLPPERVPVLATLHLPPTWYPDSIFKLNRKGFHMNCVSRSQNQTCPWSRNLLPPVSNGVDLERLGGNLRKRNFALAMGRICPEKGYHFALDAAREAGIDMLLAGEVFPYAEHLDYFNREITPRLDRERRYVGPLGFVKKRRLLSQAKCLIIPSTVAETSSLVAMEALACGTPVVAFRSGALPEIIEHGKTGLVVSDVGELANALRNVESIDPQTCREAARARFSCQRMGARYLELYSQLTHKEVPVPMQLPLRWGLTSA